MFCQFVNPLSEEKEPFKKKPFVSFFFNALLDCDKNSVIWDLIVALKTIMDVVFFLFNEAEYFLTFKTSVSKFNKNVILIKCSLYGSINWMYFVSP